MAQRTILIAAVAENGVIGSDGKIPWSSSKDMRHFAKTTKGHPVIMGHRTYLSIGKPLPERRNIVLSRDQSLNIAGCEIAGGLREAIDTAATSATGSIFIAGGGDVYRQALPLADAMIISRMGLTAEGDAKFPDYSESQWRLVKRELHGQDENGVQCGLLDGKSEKNSQPSFVIEWMERVKTKA